MLNIQLDHCVVLGWIEMVGGNFRKTIDSVVDEFNSLAKESIVFRHFSTRFIFQSILEYLNNSRGVGVHMTCQRL
jgi:hypothetical protein